MKLFALAPRQVAWLVLFCCAVCLGTQSLQAATCTIVTSGAVGAGDPGAAPAPAVLILQPTVTGDCSSLEATQAMASPLSLNVEIDSADAWTAKHGTQFGTYRAIVLGDPRCTSTDATPVAAAVSSSTVWGPAITGPAAIIGTDPEFHFFNNLDPQKTTAAQLTQNAIAFASGTSGKPGAYISLSCYYFTAAANTSVPVLQPFGTFTVQGTQADAAFIVDSANALVNSPNPLNNNGLSNWVHSSHEGFNTFPTNFSSVVTTTDGPALPYIVATQVGPQTQSQPVPTTPTQPLTFTFNETANELVQQVADLTASTFTSNPVANGTVMQVTDPAISPSAFPAMVAGTSFAVDQCMGHTGSGTDSSGAANCELYTILCTTSANSTPAGTNCPIADARTELYKDVFSASSLPATLLPTINGFHTGFAYLMAIDAWTGGFCTFPDLGLSQDLCPLNLLTNFSSVGDPTVSSTLTTKGTNSRMISTSGHPMALTTVTVVGQNSAGWNNTTPVTVDFSTQPPVIPNIPTSNNGFVAAPIQNITYAVSSPSTVPPTTTTPFPPTPNTVLTNPIACPIPLSPTSPSATVFTPPPQPLSLADGQYALWYFSTDCAATTELNFSKASHNWATSFLTVPIKVDTTMPFVSGPTLSPAGPYLPGQAGVTASYSCTDPTNGVFSGIAVCGSSTAFTIGTPNTGPLTSPVTIQSACGTYTYMVPVRDVAGNSGTPGSISYTVCLPLTFSPTIKVQITGNPPTSFQINGSFTLSGGSGIPLLNQQATLTLGGYTVTVPLTFSKGAWSFQGTIGGVSLQFKITGSFPTYTLQVQGSGAVGAVGNGSPLKLTIAGYTGTK